MASETVTQDDREAGYKLGVAMDGKSTGECLATVFPAAFAAHRTAAVAELVEVLGDLDAWLKGNMTTDGKGLQARVEAILSRHQAGLGKGDDRG